MNVNYSRALLDTKRNGEMGRGEGPAFRDNAAERNSLPPEAVEELREPHLPHRLRGAGPVREQLAADRVRELHQAHLSKPEFVKKVIAFQTDLYLRNLEAVMKSDVEVVLGGDDLGQKTGPLMRPELIEKLYGESYRRVAELVHQHKKKFVFHCCGNIYAC